MIDVRQGKAEDVLPMLEAESFDAIVTDPPAGIGFMGRDWDRDRGGRRQWIEWLAGVMAEGRRVAKPGAHALVWALPRTSHRTATALEDAGWTIDDRITHHFGQGFPKHKSKLKPATEDWWLATKPGGAKWLGVDACRVAGHNPSIDRRDSARRSGNTPGRPGEYGASIEDRSTPGAYLAERPGELLGRWPPNLVLTHHPDCVPCGERRVRGSDPASGPTLTGTSKSVARGTFNGTRARPACYSDPDGLETVAAWRCVEGCPVRTLDEQAGERTSGKAGPNGHRRDAEKRDEATGWRFNQDDQGGTLYGDTGGASRFFPQFQWQPDDFAPFLYCAKASRAERNAGCDGMPSASSSKSAIGDKGIWGCRQCRVTMNVGRHGKAATCPHCGTESMGWIPERNDGSGTVGRSVVTVNNHPTVKPLMLMRWLSKLVTRPGGRILDPFAGSGTTGLAALAEGFDATMIEQSPEYVGIINARIAAARADTPLFAD